MRHTKIVRASFLVGLLSAGLVACDQKKRDDANLTSGAKEEELAAPDGSFVSISGTVVAADDHGFVLDHGSGVITVEMDDWDWFPEGRSLMAEDQVIVYGYMDNDFYEQKKIEASSVYVQDLGTQFYASGVDEEEFPVVSVIDIMPRIQLVGEVEEVKGDEFVLETDGGSVDVNVQEMPYDPLDNEGYQKVTKGDRVSVIGIPGEELFNDLDLMADSVVTVKQQKQEKESS